MSQVQTQKDSLYAKADELSQLLYSRKFDELDEARQQTMLRSVRKLHREIAEPQPGFCFDCGKPVPFGKTECRHCHENILPKGYYWNGRWEPML